MRNCDLTCLGIYRLTINVFSCCKCICELTCTLYSKSFLDISDFFTSYLNLNITYLSCSKSELRCKLTAVSVVLSCCKNSSLVSILASNFDAVCRILADSDEDVNLRSFYAISLWSDCYYSSTFLNSCYNAVLLSNVLSINAV